ncbi:MAG TPA: sulfatase-like hydrolase/transferase [Acidobacteriaceae bacterium]|jgi:hypothetical protein|nr:sulfatase-like hydrolase/transferase [Acidobacteriaceae bacterium]
MPRSTVLVQDAAKERPAGIASAIQRMAPDCVTPLAYLILPNLPLLLMRHKLSLLSHGLINVECLLLGILSLYLPRVAVFVLLVLEIAGAFIYEICYSFQFPLTDLVASVGSLSALPAVRKVEFWLALAGVTAVSAVLAFAIPRPQRRRRAAIALLVLTLAASAVDFLDGQNPVIRPPYLRMDLALVQERLTLSPWITLGVRGVSYYKLAAKTRNTHDLPMQSASAAMFAQLKDTAAGAQPDIVLVVVESWGKFTDARKAEALTDAYADPRISAAYKVSGGTAPFDGTTVQGEVRELCHSHLGFGVFHVSASESEHCLPEKLEAKGYSTYGIHGYLGDMFQRKSWYKKLGFETILFGPDLEKQGLPVCPGAFTGVCGPSVPSWIGEHLLTQGTREPRFVYWMTLNSHVPLPLDPRLPPDHLCESFPELQNSAALCSWFRILHAVHSSIAELALDVEKRPTVFVMVGDHAPPFSDAALRQNFVGEVVPYIILMPKSLEKPVDAHGSHGSPTPLAISEGKHRGTEHESETASGN